VLLFEEVDVCYWDWVKTMAEGYGIWCITAGDWKRKSSKTEE